MSTQQTQNQLLIIINDIKIQLDKTYIDHNWSRHNDLLNTFAGKVEEINTLFPNSISVETKKFSDFTEHYALGYLIDNDDYTNCD